MENLDERNLTSARYLKTIHSIAKDKLGHADAIRMAIFILYLDLTDKLEFAFLPNYNSHNERTKALAHAYEQAIKSHRPRYAAQLDFYLLGDFGLSSLLQISQKGDAEEKILRFDYMIDALLSLQFQDDVTLATEKFTANFAAHIVENNTALIDLGRSSSGALGTQAIQASTLWLQDLIHDAEFEVLLKLEVHGRHVSRYQLNSDINLPKSSFLYFIPPRKDALVAELKQAWNDALPGASGLTMATWFSHRATTGQAAVTLLTLRECRESGIRRDLRRELIRTGNVRAVIELPRRIAKATRQFILVLGAPSSLPEDQNILFIDGRYCDALRDEPLERIAAFLSIPILARSSKDLELDWPDWRTALGSELSVRASKLFFEEQREARGFYREIRLRQLLDMESDSLDPSAWIEPIDNGLTITMLDPTPLYELLDSPQPCCAYVIGDNGVGKSFLLRGLLDYYVKKERPVRALSSTASDRYPKDSNKHPHYRYLGARTTATGTNVKSLARQMLRLLQTIYQEPHRMEVLDKASELVGFRGKHFVLPGNLKVTPESLADLKTISEEAFAELQKGDQPGFQRNGSTVIVPFDHLSSGEQQILLMLGRLIAEAHKGTLFIIDEPEASLHVAWQRALPSVLNVVRDEFQVQFAIATHSPVLLSAALDTGSYRFTARGGLIEILPERARSVERILFDGFSTYTESNREVHERCAEIVSAAVEQVNLGDEKAAIQALSEITQMRHVVEISIPSLGEGHTNAHLRLIEQARLVLSKLEEERSSAGAAG
ncbi:AAA family ATPase [Lysobacter enzymogenes]|uniref:AAA family ATPase n=1 Tax=Lysobacter enzymogenes TaxID=69 RepID=UPI001AF48985|nr:AAA family ATPase [Lysobacter enzymogenes]QQQ00261.1 ATP-binding protein [Lysobacter enzymogenes]